MTTRRKPDEWMPTHIRDYLGDTTHLSRDEHGGYLLLLFAYWLRGEALNDNDRELAHITRSTLSEWKRRLRPTLASFFRVGDGKWRHKRVEAELERARGIISERSEAGRVGAEKRWQTHGKRMAKPVANSMASEQQNDGPLPSQSQVSTEIAKAISPSKRAQGAFEEFWVHCPRKVGKGAAKKAYARALVRTAPETILAGMQRYAASRAGQDDSFTKHPATWLNADCWADEAPKANGNGAHPVKTEADRVETARIEALEVEARKQRGIIGVH